MSAASMATYALDQCTWYVSKTLSWVPGGLGNAGDWITNAPKQGLQTSSTPQIGSVIVWRPNQGGATGAGHVAVVTGFQPGNGLPIVSEMNWKGLGIQDTRNLTAAQTQQAAGYILPPGATGATPIAPSQTVQSGYSGQTCISLSQAQSEFTGLSATFAGFGTWISQGCIMHRILYVTVGGALIIFGLKFLGHDEGVKVVTAPVRLAGKAAKSGAAAGAEV